MDLDRDSDEPLYLQLYTLLRCAIEDGTYPPGRPIPSIERLVQETGLAVMTVRKSARMLADEGYVRIRPGKGTYVIRKPGSLPVPEPYMQGAEHWYDR